MSDLVQRCRRCDASFPVPEEDAGGSVRCPACGDLQRADDAPHSPARALLFALVGWVVVLAGAAGATMWLGGRAAFLILFFGGAANVRLTASRVRSPIARALVSFTPPALLALYLGAMALGWVGLPGD